jgi:hypothetical protein
MIITARAKIVNGRRLYEELRAAGVDVGKPSLLGTPFRQTGDEVRIEVADGADEKTVLAVYAAHQPTPSEAAGDKYDRLVAALEKRYPGIMEEVNSD